MIEQADNGTNRPKQGFGRAVGSALIVGAADDDCSAIGTYASAGAKFGPDLLWTAPVTLPMMYIVVYLSSKLGQVSGRGLFQVIADFYPRWLLWSVLVGVLIGNTIEAAADLGAMAAAINLFVPLPIPVIVAFVAAFMFALQVFGSYDLLRNIFRVLALALLAYVISAILAKPELVPVLSGTLLPKVRFSREYLSILVAIIGTTLSAYMYTWQSNQEVEEEIAKGRTSLEKRKGATEEELSRSRRDILIGMTFSNLIMYSIILSTGSTLHKVGQTQIETAAQAAEALRPLAGDAAGIIFAAGVIGVGFLAVPVMTTGAAFDVAQAMGWKNGMSAKPLEAPGFYLATGAFTLIGVTLNFFGFNPMQALVWAGIVQGFSTPPLLLLILLMTNDRRIMGDQVNSRSANILGGITTAVIFAASAGLVASWFL
ncbi:Nramp family divalent metal transporter [Mesorhizobium sp. B1-1-8]|uniref:Nramp family divalent metal transporter n=1 Tax=Mesorhizobium sp. B1-1-8 TaxID=2589976 RepID=UPI00112DD791|nr:Nramp family divalent metal transporter [Mesorhizobium sp. B1-1-8]UCI09630.1 Nramp family divalent metal transporter [Mesorhizobium sp. B1-1-8]